MHTHTPEDISKKSFWELYSPMELGYYGAAVVVYIALGLLLHDKVLNIGIGPLFFITWIWVVPPLWEKLVWEKLVLRRNGK